MDLITERQVEYIKVLSSYDYSKKEDEADIINYLKQQGKQNLLQLSKKEGSELIQILLKRPAEYIFPCGKKAVLHKREINCYNVLGFMEACMHACPDEGINGDIHSCSDFEKFYESELDKSA
jgi:hypothetical protein